MGIESATTVAGLNASWPLGTDPKSAGDNHLRLIKSVMQADVFRHDNIVGTVAGQTPPTGAIIEQGSNANGKWTKFADGTMIAAHNVDDVQGVNVAVGALFMTNTSITWTYPVPFASLNTFQASATRAGQFNPVGAFCVGTNGGINSAWRLWSALSISPTASVMLRLFAMGRWY